VTISADRRKPTGLGHDPKTPILGPGEKNWELHVVKKKREGKLTLKTY